VDSVPAALAGLAVFVAPLDTGRGIPNKILEALAAGRATLVSSWSARALEGQPGRDYLVADGAEDRARLVADLLADPARRDALGAAGRAYVRRHHDWDAVLDRLDALVTSVCEAPDA
jgi:glycosyltransferase involved in cell wall biosynthesis